MNPNDRRRSDSRPTSAPPETARVDASWDDETVPGLVLDDPLNEFDRVTAIPELPSDLYVQQVMKSAEDSRIPTPNSVPAVAAVERFMEPEEYFTLDSRPPLKRSPDSTAPYPVMSSAPTARPAPPTRSPGVPPFSSSTTGLELADLSFVSVTSSKVEPQAHDPRDPVLELSFEDDPLTEPLHAEVTPLGDMKDRYAMGDFSGALVIAERILQANPEDLDAPRYAQSCRDVLTQMYSARLGSLEQIVSIAVPNDQIRWLTLDHRAGFLLSLVDGGSTLDQILDISGMPRLDALRIMFQLLDQRVIALR
jgi:hypothetical protein